MSGKYDLGREIWGLDEELWWREMPRWVFEKATWLIHAWRRNFHGTPSSLPSESNQEEEEEEASNPFASSSEAGHVRPRRNQRASNHFSDVKVEIPEFKGRLDPDEFHEWLQTIERVLEYKDVPQDKKVKPVALKLRKYASYCGRMWSRGEPREGSRR